MFTFLFGFGEQLRSVVSDPICNSFYKVVLYICFMFVIIYVFTAITRWDISQNTPDEIVISTPFYPILLQFFTPFLCISDPDFQKA